MERKICTHTLLYVQSQRQTKVTLPSQPPMLRQTASKMLYFPSKLNCQLILMWKWRLSAMQDADTQPHTQTAFMPIQTDTNAEFRLPSGQLLAAECGLQAGHKEVWVCVGSVCPLLWSRPVTHLFPSVTWRLFLNEVAIVGLYLIKQLTKIAGTFVAICGPLQVCVITLSLNEPLLEEKGDLQIDHALLQFQWSAFFSHSFGVCLFCTQLSNSWLNAICVVFVLVIFFLRKWKCRIRKGESNPHVSLSSTDRNIAFAACCRALTNKCTQTEYPANHKIVMLDLLMPSDSSNCIPACSYSITTNTHTYKWNKQSFISLFWHYILLYRGCYNFGCSH